MKHLTKLINVTLVLGLSALGSPEMSNGSDANETEKNSEVNTPEREDTASSLTKGKLIWSEDFEAGMPSTKKAKRQTGASKGIYRVDNPVKSGLNKSNKVVRMYVHKNHKRAANKHRSELIPGIPYKAGKVYRVELKMLVPENYGGEQTTSQWHARPDKNADGKLIEPYRMPPMSMGTRPNKTIGAVITHDRATDEITQRSDQTRRSLASKPFQTGVWMDYVMEIKFVHNGAGKGLVKIWRNGSLHHQYSGPIGFNDKAHEYFKFGIYKHDTAIKNHKRKTGVEWESSTMFFDDILIYEK